MAERISLKWGTLKSWKMDEGSECFNLVKKYIELGACASAMCQKDTEEQKDILYEIIDKIDGEIYLSWDGKYVSKEEAKKYIREYGK